MGLAGPLGDLFLLEWQLEASRETLNHLSCYLGTSLWQVNPILHCRFSYRCPWHRRGGRILHCDSQNIPSLSSSCSVRHGECRSFLCTERELPATEGRKWPCDITNLWLCMDRRRWQAGKTGKPKGMVKFGDLIRYCAFIIFYNDKGNIKWWEEAAGAEEYRNSPRVWIFNLLDFSQF